MAFNQKVGNIVSQPLLPVAHGDESSCILWWLVPVSPCFFAWVKVAGLQVRSMQWSGFLLPLYVRWPAHSEERRSSASLVLKWCKWANITCSGPDRLVGLSEWWAWSNSGLRGKLSAPQISTTKASINAMGWFPLAFSGILTTWMFCWPIRLGLQPLTLSL